jgi:hypothetical protein
MKPRRFRNDCRDIIEKSSSDNQEDINSSDEENSNLSSCDDNNDNDFNIDTNNTSIDTSRNLLKEKWRCVSTRKMTI